MFEIQDERLHELRRRHENLRGCLDLDGKRQALADIEKKTSAPDFWGDRRAAATVLREQARLKGLLARMEAVGAGLDDAEVLIEMAQEEDDEGLGPEIDEALEVAEGRIDGLEMARMLSGELDGGNSYLVINAGAGGTESQDWAEMLLRMYLRYCDRQGWKAEIMDHQAGEEAGIKSALINVIGENAYGFLKAENGIHRLVRISPFDAAHRRHTSFAAVFAYAEVDESIEIEIDEKDLRIDVFRASGAGGQKVNKTSSAVRLMHLPTGIIVQCQNERSQFKNKDMAMKVLKSRLYDLEVRKKDEERAKLESTKQAIDFGSQIRSYVLHPYRLVKDHRTGIDVGNADSVLDGDLDRFITAYLMKTGGSE
ncbi:MAG: peptide chain release factor 2 [Pseudomonadota bacterium]